MLLSEQIDYHRIDRAAKKLSIITHPRRAEIILMLLERKKMSVTEIFQKLKIFQAEASHHLTLLKDFGVVKRTREGKKSLYFVDEEYFERLIGYVETLSAGRK